MENFALVYMFTNLLLNTRLYEIFILLKIKNNKVVI